LKFYKCYLDLWNGSIEVAFASTKHVNNALVDCQILTSGLLILAIKCASAHLCVLIIRLIKIYKGYAVTLESRSTWAAFVVWIQLFLSHSIVDLPLSSALKGSVITNCMCTFIIWGKKWEKVYSNSLTERNKTSLCLCSCFHEMKLRECLLIV
jgi:hypothetical protein